MKLPGWVSASAMVSGCARLPMSGAMPRISASSSAISAREPGSGTALSRKRAALSSIAFQRFEEGILLARNRRAIGRQRQGVNGRERLGHRVELARQTGRTAVDVVDDQRAAGQARPRLDHFVQARRAAGRLEVAKPFGLHVQTRRRRRIVFVGVGDARQPAVGQSHMAVRRAGRRQRLQVAESKAGPSAGRSRSGGEEHRAPQATCGLSQLASGIFPSFRRGISSAKLQGRKRMSSCWRRMSSQPSLQAPVEPGSAKM